MSPEKRNVDRAAHAEAYTQSIREQEKTARMENRIWLAGFVFAPLLALGITKSDDFEVRKAIRSLVEQIDPDTEGDQKLIDEMRTVALGEVSSSRSLADLHFSIEQAHGGVTEWEVSRAKAEFERRVAKLKDLREKYPHDDFQLVDAIVDGFGTYEEKHSYLTDLLNGQGGNCEARSKYASAAIEAVDPGLTSHVSLDTLYFQGKDGKLTPHIRAVFRNEQGQYVAMEGDTPILEDPPSIQRPVHQAVAAAYLQRRGALPSSVQLDRSEYPQLDANGKPYQIKPGDTDSLLAYGISKKVQTYAPSVIDNEPVAQKDPIEITLYNVDPSEWRRRAMQERPELPEQETRTVLDTKQEQAELIVQIYNEGVHAATLLAYDDISPAFARDLGMIYRAQSPTQIGVPPHLNVESFRILFKDLDRTSPEMYFVYTGDWVELETERQSWPDKSRLVQIRSIPPTKGKQQAAIELLTTSTSTYLLDITTKDDALRLENGFLVELTRALGPKPNQSDAGKVNITIEPSAGMQEGLINYYHLLRQQMSAVEPHPNIEFINGNLGVLDESEIQNVHLPGNRMVIDEYIAPRVVKPLEKFLRLHPVETLTLPPGIRHWDAFDLITQNVYGWLESSAPKLPSVTFQINHRPRMDQLKGLLTHIDSALSVIEHNANPDARNFQLTFEVSARRLYDHDTAMRELIPKIFGAYEHAFEVTVFPSLDASFFNIPPVQFLNDYQRFMAETYTKSETPGQRNLRLILQKEFYIAVENKLTSALTETRKMYEQKGFDPAEVGKNITIQPYDSVTFHLGPNALIRYENADH